MKTLPFLSIVTPTLNAQPYLEKFLRILKKQDYPKKKLEIIISDGGSTDKTLAIAKKNGCKIVRNPYVMAEPGVTEGSKHAKGDIIMVLAIDNFYKDSDGLSQMAKIFEDKTILAAFPKHDNQKGYNLFSKYCNIFTDPFNHFVYGDAANGRTFKQIYKTIRHTDIYDIYDFKTSAVSPIIALAQGFTFRRTFTRNKKDSYDDIGPILELIKKNRRLAYAYNISLYHDTVRSLSQFIKKQRWTTQNALRNKNYGFAHRKKSLTSWQRIKVYLFPIYAFSIIVPSIRSVYESIKTRQAIWLFHPVISFVAAAAIAYEVVSSKFYKKQKYVYRDK